VLNNMSASGSTLCLHVIVRNEAAIVRRALLSVANHIDCWVICDTGSTDQTKDLIHSFFLERGIPGELHSFAFENFAQARNEALDRAWASKHQFDYLLLIDADMELVVENDAFRRHLTASSYRVMQKAGVSYWNTRLLRRGVQANYRGVTHEYLDGWPDQEALDSIWFKDHADGANRAGKLDRDIRLLREGLANEPDNGRYLYYLAQSCRDAGRTAEAAEAYARRATMAGWDEETWHAQLQASRCYLGLGDNAGFLLAAARAFDLRPHRAEPLYELAKFHRRHNQNEAAMLYCEAASKLPWPKHDTLFIEDFVYKVGIREEMSVAGFYCKSAKRREAGRHACFGLVADRDAPESSRDLARHNQVFYARNPPIPCFHLFRHGHWRSHPLRAAMS
jgi:glycosyltransferase involved in cell wall biosynthesis